MAAIQAVELGLSGLTAVDNALLDEAVGGFADPMLGTAAQHAVDAATGELLFRPRKHGEDVPVEGWNDDAEGPAEVHRYHNYR